MKQKWLARLEVIEGRSNSSQLEELLDKWIAENYPNGSITPYEYFDLPAVVPKELKETITKRLQMLLKSIMNTSADLVHRPKL